MSILVHIKNEAGEAGEEGEQGEPGERIVGFKAMRCILPFSETAGVDPPLMRLPAWGMQTALNTLGIHQVPFDEVNGNVQGYSSGVETVLSPLAVHPEKTLFHELSHVILSETLPHALGEHQTHRGIMEYQAEATAYLAMYELSLLDDQTANASRGYVQEWLNHELPPEKAIQQVFVAADRILRAGRIAIAKADVTQILTHYGATLTDRQRPKTIC